MKSWFYCLFLITVYLLSCEKIEYIDRVEYVYDIDTLYLPATDRYKGYETVVVSKQNGKFSTLKDAFSSLDEGKFILYFPDSIYEESVDKNLDIREGWIIKGKGIDKTKIVFRDANPSAHLFNLNVVGSSEIRDVSLLSITTNNQSRYCIHMDDSRVQDLDFLCDNVCMEGKWDSDEAFINNGNMLVLGIGTWNNWHLRFKNCVMIGDERIGNYANGFGVINLHNNDCDFPGKVEFDNCKIVSNGNAVLIRDYHSLFDNNNRMQDTICFNNTEVVGYLVGYSHNEARNGYHFYVTNSTVSGILDSQYLADCNYVSYSNQSLPSFSSVDYIENLTNSELQPGTLVKLKLEQKEYFWNTDNVAPLVVGFNVEETDADAIVLSGALNSGSAHVLTKGVGKIGDWYNIQCYEGEYAMIKGNSLISSPSKTNLKYLGERYIKISEE